MSAAPHAFARSLRRLFDRGPATRAGRRNRPAPVQAASERLDERVLLSVTPVSVETYDQRNLADATVDADGNRYIARVKSGDVIIAKYDPVGTLTWVQQIGGSGSDIVNAVDVDRDGNVYIAGEFSNTVTFGNQTFTSTGGTDLFVTKLTAAGEIVWTSVLGRTASSDLRDYGYSVAVDDSAEDRAAWSVYTGGASNGEGLVQKLAGTDGASVWTRYVTVAAYSKAAGSAVVIGVDVAADGSVFIGGNFTGSAKFGGVTLTGLGGSKSPGDMFVGKMTADGTHTWTQRLGGTAYDSVRDLATDGANAYLTGSFSGSAAFGVVTLSSAGGEDVFVAKVGATGAVQWARRAGGKYQDAGHGVAVDAAGNVYVTGAYSAAGATFGTQSFASRGGTDAFLSQLDPTGQFVATWTAGGTGGDTGNDVAIDGAGNICVFGGILGTATFPVAGGEQTVSTRTAGVVDVFVWTFAEPAPVVAATSADDASAALDEELLDALLAA